MSSARDRRCGMSGMNFVWPNVTRRPFSPLPDPRSSSWTREKTEDGPRRMRDQSGCLHRLTSTPALGTARLDAPARSKSDSSGQQVSYPGIHQTRERKQVGRFLLFVRTGVGRCSTARMHGRTCYTETWVGMFAREAHKKIWCSSLAP